MKLKIKVGCVWQKWGSHMSYISYIRQFRQLLAHCIKQFGGLNIAYLLWHLCTIICCLEQTTTTTVMLHQLITDVNDVMFNFIFISILDAINLAIHALSVAIRDVGCCCTGMTDTPMSRRNASTEKTYNGNVNTSPAAMILQSQLSFNPAVWKRNLSHLVFDWCF